MSGYFIDTNPVDPATLEPVLDEAATDSEPVVPEGVTDLLADSGETDGGGCCGGACCG